MSGYDDISKRHTGTGCCGTNCSRDRNENLEDAERIRSCFCQENVGCLDRTDCGGFRPRGTASTGACPGPCQCAEEEAWNLNVPPKPNCEWLANFSQLRQQWSDHGRKLNCKCCSCTPQYKAAPCKPCLPPIQDEDSLIEFKKNRHDNRLGGGACSSSNNCKTKKNKYQNDDTNNEFCTSSKKPILKNRSCNQSIPSGCMCQPMPRTCNCPHPVQVDVRADRECSCACPSSPECACPPSERKFTRSKVKCQNAKLCYTPRQKPGPKCNCTECQPSLPQSCDPCTSTKCHPLIPTIPSYNKGTKYNNKINNNNNNNHDIHKKSSPLLNDKKTTKFSYLDSTECCTPMLYQGQSENYYKNFEKDQQVNEEMKDENYYNNFISKCQRNSDKSINYQKKSNYSIQDNNKNFIIKNKQCTCGSSGKCNFCCSININNKSKESCKIEFNNCNNIEKNNNNNNNNYLKNNYSHKTSKFIESLKRVTKFFPSMKTKV